MTLAACRSGVKVLLKDDYSTDAEIDTLIRRAERKMERDFVRDGEYKPQQLTATTTLTITASGVVLPADFQRMRTVWINMAPLRYASPDKMQPESTPTEGDATLYYYKRLDPLQETTSNWLYDIAEDLYVYATALQWVPYYKDDQRLRLWEAYYGDALNSLREANKAQPAGNWIQQKGRPYRGFYTIQDGAVRFNA